ncbi:hypothetical protein Dimus_015243 [Dionaea muscipula]
MGYCHQCDFCYLNGAMSLGHTTPCLSVIAAGQAAVNKIFETIGRKPQIWMIQMAKKWMIFMVIFKVYENALLVFHLSQTVALVGESGSGRLTVISLFQRCYDPDSGCITVEGVEIKKFLLKWLRQEMGLMSQEPVLFNDAIADKK